MILDLAVFHDITGGIFPLFPIAMKITIFGNSWFQAYYLYPWFGGAFSGFEVDTSFKYDWKGTDLTKTTMPYKWRKV